MEQNSTAVTTPPPPAPVATAMGELLELFGRLLLGAGRLRQRIRSDIIADLDGRLASITDSTGDPGVDAFGMEPAALRPAAIGAALLYRLWFRCRVQDIDRLPRGPVIMVANHGGQLPFDGVMITTALLLDADPPRLARSLTDRWVPSLPFVSTFYSRCGVVVGSPENARRLLADGAALLVFPEGMAGISKTIDRAYELQPLGTGFMRLAIETGAPVVPVAVVGSEEQYPTLYNLESAGKALGLPSLPIWLQLPIPVLGLLPLPVRYRLTFGEPMHFDGDPDDEEALIERKTDEVKTSLEALIKQSRTTRGGVFW